METRRPSDRYRELAADIIAHDGRFSILRESGVDIAYLASDKERYSHGRAVFGECERVPWKYRWAIPHEFTITIYEPHAEALDGEQLRVLMTHELMHVGCERDGNEWTFSVVPHDVEDFRAILDEHGLGWADAR